MIKANFLNKKGYRIEKKSKIDPAEIFYKKVLHFSKEQLNKGMKEIKVYRKSLEKKEKEIDKLKWKLYNILKSQEDDSIINYSKNKLGDLAIELQEIKFNHYKKIIEICNEDQKKILDSIISRRMQKGLNNKKLGSPNKRRLRNYHDFQ